MSNKNMAGHTMLDAVYTV